MLKKCIEKSIKIDKRFSTGLGIKYKEENIDLIYFDEEFKYNVPMEPQKIIEVIEKLIKEIKEIKTMIDKKYPQKYSKCISI